MPWPDETGDKTICRPVVEVVRRIPLLDLAVGHDADLVGHGGKRLVLLVVRDEDRRHAFPFENGADFERQTFAQVVEVGKTARQSRMSSAVAPAHAPAPRIVAGRRRVRAGTLPPCPSRPTVERQLFDLPGGASRAACQAEADVGRDREVRKQRVILEKPMPMRRFSGGMRKSGRVTGDALDANFSLGDRSNPAMQRKSVVLLQPDGPNRQAMRRSRPGS